MFITFLMIALLKCCSPTSGEVWVDVQVPCESLWSAATPTITTWQPNRRYTVTNCPVSITSPSSPIFTVALPTLTSNTSRHTTCGNNNENVAYFGNIAVTLRGGSVAPRFVLPSSSVPTSQQIHVVNVSMVLDGVSVRLQGSLSPDGAPLGGMDPLRAGGLLMAIIAHSWWNVSLQIRHSIMMVTPGWIFNWTQADARSAMKRIAGIVALSTIPSSPTACNSSSGGAYLVVSNSSVSMTGVIGVSVLFHIDLTSGSSTSSVAAVHNVRFQIEKASRVVFELFSNEADMCTRLMSDLKLRLSEQFIFLVSGVGDSDYDLGEGTTVTNVSCAVTSSTVSIAYNPDKRCRGYRSRMDAGVAHLRGHGIVRAVSFLLSSSEPHSFVVVAPLPVPTPTTVVVRDSWSRAFVFGISLVNTTTDVAVMVTGTQTECTVVASDYAAYFMLFSIAVLLRSFINLSDANITTIATGGTGMLGRVAGVIVLEYVNSTINARTTLTSLRASVQSQPGNGTGLMATSTSMFYVKGGMMDCNTSLRHCSFIGNAVGGVLQGPPLLMVTISVVTYLPVAKEFNITNTSLLLLNCSITSIVAVNVRSLSPLMSTFMITASVALVVAPILTISSTIEVAQCTASIAALEIQGSMPLKRSALGAMLSSTPIPSEGMLKLVTASSGYGPEQSTLIELLRLSPYRNVTVIVTQTNLTMVPDAFYLSTSSGFEGAFVIILPRTLINDSSIFLSECSFQNPSRSANHEPQSTGSAFFLSSIVGAVGPSIINNSVVSATSMTTFAHGMTTGEGELVFGVGAMIMMSALDIRSYANDAPSARELHQSPLVALQPTTSAFIPLTVTNMVVQPGCCIVVHDSTFRGFQNLTTNVLFPAPTSFTNASLRGLSSWVAPWMTEYCGGDSSVDKRILLSCVMWSYPSTVHDSSSTPPPRPVTKLMAALRTIPPSNIRISSCANSFTSTPELTVSHAPHAAVTPPSTTSVAQRGINGILGFTSSAAAAVSAVLGGGGMVAADFQALALMGVSPCAPSNLQSSSSISRYILVSPFYDLGDEAQIVGGIGLVLVVVLLQHSVRATTSNVVTSNSFTDATCHNKEGRDEENAKDLVAPRRKSIFDEFMEFITSILQQYPKHSYTIAVILIPGVWRSTIAILLQGGDGAAWGAAGSIIVAIIGACSVVGGCVWRWREGNVIDSISKSKDADSGGKKRQALQFKVFRQGVYKEYEIPRVPRVAYPTGFWYPHDLRETHEPLRDAIHGGERHSRFKSLARHMSAYPTVVALIATTVMSFPFALSREGESDGKKRNACIASWVLLCVTYAAAGVVVWLLRPGRAPLSDSLYALFMGVTVLLNIVVAVESSASMTLSPVTEGDSAAGGEQSSTSNAFFVFSYMCTIVGVLKLAHQCFIAIWERHVFQRSLHQSVILHVGDEDVKNNSILTGSFSRFSLHSNSEAIQQQLRGTTTERLHHRPSAVTSPSHAATMTKQRHGSEAVRSDHPEQPQLRQQRRVITVSQIEQLERIIQLICDGCGGSSD